MSCRACTDVNGGKYSNGFLDETIRKSVETGNQVPQDEQSLG